MTILEILDVTRNLIILVVGISTAMLVVWPKNPNIVRWISGMIMVLAFAVFVADFYWEDLRKEAEPPAETIRNLVLAVATVIGIIIAIWRSSVAEHQADTAQRQSESIQSQVEIAQDQVKIIQLQADTAQQSLLNERYQTGSEMLGSSILTVRLGGIYALQSLAEENSEQYHVPVMKLLSAFVRNTARDDAEGDETESARTSGPRQDVQDAMTAIGRRSETAIQLERNSGFKLDLMSANLRCLRLIDANLSDADLFRADLTDTWLSGANLSGTCLGEANLSGARLGGADVAGSEWWSTNLSGAFLSQTTDDPQEGVDWGPVRGLTQEQLDWACGDTEPSMSNKVIDTKTGEQLIWHGRPCNDGE